MSLQVQAVRSGTHVPLRPSCMLWEVKRITKTIPVSSVIKLNFVIRSIYFFFVVTVDFLFLILAFLCPLKVRWQTCTATATATTLTWSTWTRRACWPRCTTTSTTSTECPRRCAQPWHRIDPWSCRRKTYQSDETSWGAWYRDWWVNREEEMGLKADWLMSLICEWQYWYEGMYNLMQTWKYKVYLW